MNITVNVDLENIDLNTVVGQRVTHDEDGRTFTDGETLGQLVAEQLVREVMKTDDWRGLKGIVKHIRDEVIRDAVNREVAEALTGPVPLTNTYGEPTGKTTTIRQLIADMAKEALAKPADRYGSGESVVRQALRKEVDVALAAELLATVKEEKAKVVTAIRGKAADLIAKSIEQGLGTR